MLRLENVCYRYKTGDVDVLRDISVNFETGKFHSIVGPSGVGKTTLLSIMAGLDRPSSGKVFIGDEDLAGIDLNVYRRDKISMVFQSFHLFPLLTALENTSYLLEARGVRRRDAEARARELLTVVGIDESKHRRYPSNLSGGEQQRVAIARSLSTGARVILADEPTGNLDMANSSAIVGLLKSLAQDEDYCVIVVTHNMEIADGSDVVFRMMDGAIAPPRMEM
ncbi:MAG: ABC transporter ATP-binding protein [Defluviitaleaceae bacterium]|nr:ABC transporter ATP-binding protein [Defluviitaleaceae bacterium]